MRASLFIVACAAWLLTACGGDADEKPQDAEEINAQDQLVPLRLKEARRVDRLPPVAASRAAFTEVPLASVTPIFPADDIGPDEIFSQAALAQLKRLATAERVEDIDGLLADGFRSSKFWEAPASASTPDVLTVEVGGRGPGSMKELAAAGLLDAVRGLGTLHLKIVGVEPARPPTHLGNLVTRVHVEADRDGSEYTASWSCEWIPSDPPQLTRLNEDEYEAVDTAGEWFVDATRSAIGHNPRFDAQVLRGIEYWSQRITRIGDLAMTGHHGVAVGDVNGDGLEDIYACDGGSLPNQLYLQQPDGTAKEVAAQWDVAWLEDSRGALLVDLDNDGDQDLVVATIAMIAFAENKAGKFHLRGGFPGAPYPFSLSAADFDSDGDLDIYTCVYSAGDEAISGKRGFEASSPVPFNDAENGGRNVLLSNLGDFQFGDVTDQVGLEKNNTRWSFAAAWEDMDRDGDPDLYVANDFGRNCLYRNDGGRFSEIAAEAGVEDMAAGMSVAWGDFNRDGAADLHVGNMFSSAGQRVAFQRKFDDGKRRMARGNSLFAAKIDAYEDVSESAGITVGGWAWSSALADLDNDGWQDIVVANGYLTNTRDDDL